MASLSLYAVFLLFFQWASDAPSRNRSILSILVNMWRVFSPRPQPPLFAMQPLVEMGILGSSLVYILLLHILQPVKITLDYLLKPGEESVGEFLVSLVTYHYNLTRMPYEFTCNLARFLLLFVLNVLQMHVSIGSTFFLSGMFRSPHYKVSSYLVYYLLYGVVQVVLLVNALLVTYYIFNMMVVRPLTVSPEKTEKGNKHLRLFRPDVLFP